MSKKYKFVTVIFRIFNFISINGLKVVNFQISKKKKKKKEKCPIYPFWTFLKMSILQIFKKKFFLKNTCILTLEHLVGKIEKLKTKNCD